jgi:hypothetical protein
MMLKDAAEWRASLESMAATVTRVVSGHGKLVHDGVVDALRSAAARFA